MSSRPGEWGVEAKTCPYIVSRMISPGVGVGDCLLKSYRTSTNPLWIIPHGAPLSTESGRPAVYLWSSPKL